MVGESNVGASRGATLAALHLQGAVHICRSELPRLESIAALASDARVAELLSKKLTAARIVDRDGLPLRTARLGSLVEFAWGDTMRFGQLVASRATMTPAWTISIDSFAGAGLIGLKAGQSVLWPDDEDALIPLHLHHVSVLPGVLDWGLE